MSSILTEIKINELLIKYPFVENFFNENMIDMKEIEMLTFNEYLNMITEEQIEDRALNIEKLKIDLVEYIDQMKMFLGMKDESGVEVLTILAGQDKSGNSEGFDRLDIKKSEIISIVGPTGSRK